MQFLSGGNIHINNLEKLVSSLGCKITLTKNNTLLPFEKKIRIDKLKLVQFCKEKGISSLFLFGSVLRNDFKEESDIDVMIKFKRPITFFELSDIEEGLKKLFNTKHRLDIVTEEGISPLIREEVEKLKEVLYDEAA